MCVERAATLACSVAQVERREHAAEQVQARLWRCCSEMPLWRRAIVIATVRAWLWPPLIRPCSVQSLLATPKAPFKGGFQSNNILQASDLPFVLILSIFVCLPSLSISLFLEQVESQGTQVAFLGPGKLGWCWPQRYSFFKRKEAGLSEGAQLLRSS